MIQFAELFNDCLSRFRETPEFSVLNKHRAGGESLSSQERQAIIDSVEQTFAPMFDQIRADASSLTDSDLVFCVLTGIGVGTTKIADCLTISPHTVRVRKHRLREKLPASWYDVFYGEGSIEDEPVDEVSHESRLLFVSEIGNCFKKFFKTDGRANRMEYMSFLIFTAVVVLTNNTLEHRLFILSYMACHEAVCGFFSVLLHIISWIITFIVLIPMYTVTVRRLHDLNCSGLLALFFCGIPSAIVVVSKLINTIYSDVFILNMDVTSEFGCLVIAPLKFSINVAFAMFFLQILVFSVKGTRGANDYGAAPL